jgi:hypothetical protein
MRKIIFISILCLFSKFLYGQLSAGRIGSDAVICYRSAPAPLSFIEPPSGGTPSYSYRWQRSNDGTSWSDITGTTASQPTYSPPILGRTAHFRCRVTDSQDLLGVTNNVIISVRSDLVAGTILSSDPLAYSGTIPGNIIETVSAEGGEGSYTYQWQISEAGLYWNNINGAISRDYTPESILEDTWFRRVVIDAACGSTASNPVRIEVEPITLYASEIPQNISTLGMPLDLGTLFEVMNEGFVTHIRFYATESEGGNFQTRFWRQNTQSNVYDLVTGPIELNLSAGTAGWREFYLPTPIEVEPNSRYIVSITTLSGNQYFPSSSQGPLESNEYVRYLGGGYTSYIGTAPNVLPNNDSYFRDIIFVPFSAGIAGPSQTICYNTVPSPITEIMPSSGASGGYSYQWQRSSDGLIWNNIDGATMPEYSPSMQLISDTYFRRLVSSGDLTKPGNQILITVNDPFTLASLNDDITIFENTSTSFNILISGGTPPYRIEFSRNDILQTPILNYESGTEIFTGVLTSGEYSYELVSVTDAHGCTPESTGNPITVSVSGSYAGSETKKALVLVNSSAVRYGFYYDHIRPYFDWFGIPYDVCDLLSMQLPNFNDYALIILGHENIFSPSPYPIAEIEEALTFGVGLYSFDPGLFDNTIGSYSTLLTPVQVISQFINIPNTSHFITQYHADDIHNIPINIEGTHSNNYDVLTKRSPTGISVSTALINGITLAEMTDGTNTASLLQISEHNSGRIVKWDDYLWMDNDVIGSLNGMDDILWRSLVWAAKKPFVMQGLPPFITMRVDDVNGVPGTEDMRDLQWLHICNEYGFIPWLGLFLDNSSENFHETLRDLITNNLATASPHSFTLEECIYYNYNSAPNFSVADSVRKAADWFVERDLPMSNYLIAHHYLLLSDALPEIRNMGIEFIGTKIPCDLDRYTNYPGPALTLEPYMVNRYKHGGPGVHFYADNVNWEGNDFFICLTEIGNDAGYEWAPNTTDVPGAIARGVRQLNRSLSSMVLPVLFTHEYYIDKSANEWRQILEGITSAIEPYNPEQMSTDDALKYIRAKKQIKIINARSDNGLVSISCSGVNDMPTRCYVFTESNGQISHNIVSLPQVTSNTTPVTLVVAH